MIRCSGGGGWCWNRCIWAELEDEVRARLAEVGQSFGEALAAVGLVGIGLVEEGEQGALHDVEAL